MYPGVKLLFGFVVRYELAQSINNLLAHVTIFRRRYVLHIHEQVRWYAERETGCRVSRFFFGCHGTSI